MASFDNLIMDSALRVSAFDLENKSLLLMMTQPTDATLNATSESTEVSGLKGLAIASLDRSKGCTFEMTNGLFVTNAFAAQVGADVVEASSSAPIIVPFIETVVLNVTANGGSVTAASAVLSHEPADADVQVYKMTSSGGQGERLEMTAGGSASSGEFVVDGSTITFNAADFAVGDSVIVVYNFKANTGIKITNDSESYTKNVRIVVDIIARDVCTDKIYHTVLEMPRAKLDGNFSLAMGTEAATHPLSAMALPNLCSADKTLFNWYIVED